MNRDIILLLIRDSLINFRLVSGLNMLGLNADPYNLYLEDTIFSLMGLDEDEKSDWIFEKIFLPHAEKVKTIDFCHSRHEIDKLAEEIYHELLEAKKIIYKKLK